jgi:hypothetical protein
MACYTENRRAPALPDTNSKPVWETFGRPRDEHQASHGIPPATLGINQQSPLGTLTPCPAKKTKTKTKKLNNKQGTKNTQQRGWSAMSTPEKGGRAREADLQANFQ